VQRGQKVAIGADGKKQVTQFAKADDLKKYVHNLLKYVVKTILKH
jgi:hypothetical protein